MNEGYIRSLDGIRAIAIILVMTFHFELTEYGWFGVQLFFVLSGFLISGILWRQKFKPIALSAKFKNFWIRRALRIFPLYFGLLFFLTLSYLFFKFPFYFPNFISYLVTYTFNFTRTLPQWQRTPLFTHLWSLSVEEQFYFVFPFIVFLCSPRFVKGFMVTIIFLSPVIRFLLGEYYKSKGFSSEVIADAVYWNTLSHLDAFFIGGLIPILSLEKKIKKPALFFYGFLLLAVAAGAINYIFSYSPATYLSDLGYRHWDINNYQHVWFYTVLNLFFAAFILILVNVHSIGFGILKKFLETNIMVRIGKVSYGMYVFHWPILAYFYFRVFHPSNDMVRLLLFFPYLALVYLFSEVSYRAYESKFIKLKDRFFPYKQKMDKESEVKSVS